MVSEEHIPLHVKAIAIAMFGMFGMLIGSALFLWGKFGSSVYLTYLAGAVMSCF